MLLRRAVAESEVPDDCQRWLLTRPIAGVSRLPLEHVLVDCIQSFEGAHHGSGGKGLNFEPTACVHFHLLGELLKVFEGVFARAPEGLNPPPGRLLAKHDRGHSGDQCGRRCGDGLQNSASVKSCHFVSGLKV
ncbi:hypothetical protein VARIO8X_110131 [Burkholderiales bacterium 8X]|nr:hypothetical protein VARIO8X_110131 [Burkholderiales bacterium 8X]